MAKEENIASGAGIAVGGNSPASKAVEIAMRNEAMNGHSTPNDTALVKARMQAARFDAKPPERR